MIKTNCQYPWGERDIEYEEWRLVKIDPVDGRTEVKEYTQDGFFRIKLSFCKLKSHFVEDENYFEYNSNCFGVRHNGKETLYYIIGFLK